ncbi:uncharacterized protein LOC135482549 [Lineus longissimus]|uniref:uncharacterized protein LOC135482549 n=1 Tax=Lineus longissimus TaxID=88925 RepID=UPI002B4DB11B
MASVKLPPISECSPYTATSNWPSVEIRTREKDSRERVVTVLGSSHKRLSPDVSLTNFLSGNPYLNIPAYDETPTRRELVQRRQHTDDIRRWWRGRQRAAEKDRRDARDVSLSRSTRQSSISVTGSLESVEQRKFESMKTVPKRETNCSKGVSENMKWDDSLSSKSLPKLSRSLTEVGKVIEGGAPFSVPAPPPAGSPRSSNPNTRRSQTLLRKPSVSKMNDQKPLAKSAPSPQLEEDALRRPILSRPTYTWSIKLADDPAQLTDKVLPPVGQLSPAAEKDMKKHFFVHPKWESEKIAWKTNGSKMKTGWI